MPYQGDLKIAIVHDELTKRGGAEVVLEELIRLLPNADLYSLYTGQPKMRVGQRTLPIKTSFLQKAPLWFKRHPSRLLPALPHAAEQFDLSSYDLVLSSASGFSKSVITRINVAHWCYCHTPIRYLWDDTHEVIKQYHPLLNWPTRLILHYLRLADYAAAQRVDLFIANSQYTQKRIKVYYSRRSQVIYPPVDVSFFTPSYQPPQDNKQKYFLCVGRLRPSKHFAQVVRVCAKLDLPLTIIGRGQEEKKLKRLGGNKIHLVPTVTSARLRNYYRQARALVQPAVEDFGLAAAESLACGTPVIAYGRGAVTEVVTDGVTGILYDDNSDEALANAVRRLIQLEKNLMPEIIQSSVLKFSRASWQKNMLRLIQHYENNRRRSHQD